MKKILSLFLSLFLVFGFTSTIYAAGPSGTEKTMDIPKGVPEVGDGSAPEVFPPFLKAKKAFLQAKKAFGEDGVLTNIAEPHTKFGYKEDPGPIITDYLYDVKKGFLSYDKLNESFFCFV